MIDCKFDQMDIPIKCDVCKCLVVDKSKYILPKLNFCRKNEDKFYSVKQIAEIDLSFNISNEQSVMKK